MSLELWKSIFDEASFVQTFAYAMPDNNEMPGDGVITGYGAVSGRLVYTAVQTGDGLGRIQAEKIAKIVQMATKRGAPFLFFMNTQGIRLDEGFDALSGYGTILQAISMANSEIPTVCCIEGNCFGTASVLASMFDFVIMPEDGSYASVQTSMDKTAYEGIASSQACSRKGFATLRCAKEQLSDLIAKLIHYLPDNASSGTDNYDGTTDDVNRCCSYCESLRYDDVYDVRDVIKEIADNQLFLEVWNDYAPSVVTAFARFGGHVACIIANQPTEAGGMMNDASCKKASMIIDYCDRFSIPLITLVNTSGLSEDISEEQLNLSSSAALLATAYVHAEMPKLSMIIGKSYGNSCLLMNSRALGADYVYAWNHASICVGKPEVNALLYFTEDISNAADPVLRRNQAIETYRNQYCVPAQKGYIDDIIAAGETRARIINFIQMMA